MNAHKEHKNFKKGDKVVVIKNHHLMNDSLPSDRQEDREEERSLKKSPLKKSIEKEAHKIEKVDK